MPPLSAAVKHCISYISCIKLVCVAHFALVSHRHHLGKATNLHVCCQASESQQRGAEPCGDSESTGKPGKASHGRGWDWRAWINIGIIGMHHMVIHMVIHKSNCTFSWLYMLNALSSQKEKNEYQASFKRVNSLTLPTSPHFQRLQKNNLIARHDKR